SAMITTSPEPLGAMSGAKIQLMVTVKNTSARLWPAREARETKYKFRLGDHWLATSGEMKQMNDSRADVVEDVKPSQEIVLPLTVTAPDEPGDYILELDMVQEHVAWFKDKGSPTCRLPVRVTASPGSEHTHSPRQPVIAPTTESVPEPEMDMY